MAESCIGPSMGIGGAGMGIGVSGIIGRQKGGVALPSRLCRSPKAMAVLRPSSFVRPRGSLATATRLHSMRNGAEISLILSRPKSAFASPINRIGQLMLFGSGLTSAPRAPAISPLWGIIM